MTKLFIGNLPFSATEESVRALFAPHGTIESLALINDRDTGRPRGFGFIEMSNADASKAMQALISDLARDAMVIIDAPPLLPVTDAAILTRAADGAIVVVSHNGTLDTELAAALGNISAVHGRTLGIVFNRIRRSASSGFYGDYYRYEYKPDNGRRKLKGRQRAKSAAKGGGKSGKGSKSRSHSDTPTATH